jgi:EpsI family protein
VKRGSLKGCYRIALSCVFLIGAWAALHFRSYGDVVILRKPLQDFPAHVGEWRGTNTLALAPDVLDVLRVEDYVMRRYVDETGAGLWLYIAYWSQQRKGAQMHSPKHCLPGGGWEPVEARQVVIPVNGEAEEILVNRYLIQKDDAMQLVLYWYQAQGEAVASEVGAKVHLLKNAVLHNRTDGALIRVTSPITGSVQQTFKSQVRYIQAIYPLLPRFLPD